MALATLIPQSTEPLLDEAALRQRMEALGLGSVSSRAGAGGAAVVPAE